MKIQGGSYSDISDVEGFMAYRVVYAPDDTATVISIVKDYPEAEESNRRASEPTIAPIRSPFLRYLV